MTSTVDKKKTESLYDEPEALLTMVAPGAGFRGVTLYDVFGLNFFFGNWVRFRSKWGWGPNKMIKKSLHHKLVELWLLIINCCHPEMVTPEQVVATPAPLTMPLWCPNWHRFTVFFEMLNKTLPTLYFIKNVSRMIFYSLVEEKIKNGFVKRLFIDAVRLLLLLLKIKGFF